MTFGAKQSQSMWGNDKFAGEDIFSGSNFDFGKPSDISGIVGNADANISFNFGGQNKFGSFNQGDMMSTTFGGQGGQMNAPASRNSGRMR